LRFDDYRRGGAGVNVSVNERKPARRTAKVESDTEQKPEEENVLQKSVRKIVLSRETIPRAPRWARAFRSALFRFARDLAEAETTEATQDTSTSEDIDDER